MYKLSVPSSTGSIGRNLNLDPMDVKFKPTVSYLTNVYL